MIFLKSLRGEHEFFFNAESAERRLRGIPQFPSFRAFRVKKVVNWTSDFLTVSENQPIPPNSPPLSPNVTVHDIYLVFTRNTQNIAKHTKNDGILF